MSFTLSFSKGSVGTGFTNNFRRINKEQMAPKALARFTSNY